MNLVRNNIKRDFAQVPNTLINDNSLSDRARFLFCYMAAKPDGWKFYQDKMAKDLKMSLDTLRKYIAELIDSGWISRTMVREGGKFDSYEYDLNPEPCRKNTDTVKNGLGKIPTRENSVLNNTELEITFTKEKTIKKESNPPESVKEVIDYLNAKANTSFKATTKETIQFVTARQKVDGWELEDFKLVIDFKVNDWGKDDRMKQYICPSTLFRASNAEKYMQAAKAWKESCKVGQNGKNKSGVVPLFRQENFSNPDKSKFKF
jgi:uncharacterized phage protein (TIGR02220 family)